jgi:hypothetical protein
LQGYYSTIGSWLAVRIQVALGSTANLMNGLQWKFSLPPGMSVPNIFEGPGFGIGQAWFYRAGQFRQAGFVNVYETNDFFEVNTLLANSGGSTSSANRVGYNMPFTWTSGDVLQITYIGEWEPS